MKFILFICIFFAYHSFAQKVSDDEIANQLYSIAEFSGTGLNNIGNLAPDPCFTPQVEIKTEKQLVCNANNTKEKKLIAIPIDDIKDFSADKRSPELEAYLKKKNIVLIVEEIKNHQPGKDYETGYGGFVISFEGENDNLLYGVVGVIERKLLNTSGLDGDDHGPTVTNGLEFSKVFDNGLRLSGNVKSKLYTQRDKSDYDLTGMKVTSIDSHKAEGRNGYWVIEGGKEKYLREDGKIYVYDENDNIIETSWRQQFNNIVDINVGVDNIQQDKKNFFKTNIGIIKIDSQNEKGFLYGTGIQNPWHNLTSDYNFENMKSDNPATLDLYIRHMQGLQSIVNIGENCRYRAQIGAFAQVGTHEYNNNLGVTGAFEFFRQKPGSNKTMIYGANATYTLHQLEDNKLGNMLELQAKVGMSKRTYAVEMGMKKQIGDQPIINKYNDHEPIMVFTVKSFIGTGAAKERRFKRKINKLK